MRNELSENMGFNVVVNHEGQYSLWPCGKANALGWNSTGITGSKEVCLAYIRDTWTDMRPLSLRETMNNGVQKPARLAA